MPTRPVWAEISLDRLTRNFDLLHRSATGGASHAELLAVVKANAYGHGVETCGPTLAAAGARWLGVTSVEEGATLRRALGMLPGHLSSTRILVMSSLWHGEAETVIERSLTPQVWESYQLDLLRQAILDRGVSSFPVHLEIDTGMSRQGIAPGLPLTALLHQFRSSPLTIEGVLTHFSAPERQDQPDTDLQIARFSAVLEQLHEVGIHPGCIHAGNSATVFDAKHIGSLAALASRYGAKLLLRPGLALYGYPARFTAPAAVSGVASSDQNALGTPAAQSALQPVLAWKSRITSLRQINAGDFAGYNSIFRAGRPTRLALIPVGYADGLNRLLSNPVPSPTSAMLVRGLRAPIAGRISMDQTMLDVTDVPGAAIGDEVILLGEQEPPNQPRQAITAWEHADLCQTIPYEILCNIAARVPRVVAE